MHLFILAQKFSHVILISKVYCALFTRKVGKRKWNKIWPPYYSLNLGCKKPKTSKKIVALYWSTLRFLSGGDGFPDQKQLHCLPTSWNYHQIVQKDKNFPEELFCVGQLLISRPSGFTDIHFGCTIWDPNDNFFLADVNWGDWLCLENLNKY